MKEPKYTEAQFCEKYDLYSDMVYKMCVVHTGNCADAEDLMQEIFLKYLYRSPVFESPDHERHWIIRVTVNACKDFFKGFWKKNIICIDEIEREGITHEESGILQEIIKLPEKYKMVIHLFYYENYSVSEISQILKISESAVKMHLKRGREMLRMELEQ